MSDTATLPPNAAALPRPGKAFDTLRTQHVFTHPPKDGTSYPLLQQATQPHIDSFNALTRSNLLNKAARDIGPRSVFDGKSSDGLGNKLTFWIEDVQIGKPSLPARERFSANRKVYPAEARERLTTYRARLLLKLCWQVNGPHSQVYSDVRECGQIPIMVRSNRCHLESMSPAELIRHKEESEEMGGYFIVNGNEKLIRMLIMPKRNFPTALVRPSFANRGPSYTQFGISIRCVRADESAATNTMHYLSSGSLMYRFSWRKNEYLIPVVMLLRALVETSDREIFQGIVGRELDNTFLTDRVELLLRTFKSSYHLRTRTETLAYLGAKFRVVLGADADVTDAEVGRQLLQRVILVHLPANRDKFRCLLFMARKLYALAAGDCAPDNPDSPQHQEILLGGFLYGNLLKEKMEDYLDAIKRQIQLDVRRNPSAVDFIQSKYLHSVLSKLQQENIGAKMTYFLSTGNLLSASGLDLQQATGFTVVAEKINFYRFLSHFRMVHRGAFFAELKTTTVRKLLPEAWGFLCPVHTPDGAPCGLLNHLAHTCKITTAECADAAIVGAAVARLGVDAPDVARGECSVQLDGRVIGSCTHKLAAHVAQVLRHEKVQRGELPLDLEIGYVPPSRSGQYPGLYIFSNPARMTRPVKYVALDKEDWVGPFESAYLEIACGEGEGSHAEYSPTNMLSIVANMTPFSNFNQSPRNMYQCQMGKQTMGTPGTAIRYRTDNKMYRLQTAQTPVVRPRLHDSYGLDHYPNGTNAIVAVVSYTGYDMEDAMILNKSAHERGFGYGTVYKSEKIDLARRRRRGEPIVHHFGFAPGRVPSRWLEKLDTDGLPHVGVKLEDGDPMAAYFDESNGRTYVEEYHGTEPAYVEEVRLLGSDTGDSECQMLQIKLRVTRAPIIGDKFSSRHGQKGVCSQKWPAIDMPFSESGMQPDVIINPHAFPSRMTIGMFVESLAGKAGALHGIAQDATPFTFSERDTAADHFGEQLRRAGYNFHGNEPMYSGITGREFQADIYLGVVYYQRLRHMVNDKFQVRTTGPIHNLTRQPVKGRKRAGGIRFGEMERDAVIAHGTAFLLQDRLMNCSDYALHSVCRTCGSILSSMAASNGGFAPGGAGSGASGGASVGGAASGMIVRCRSCARDAPSTLHDIDVWQDGSGRRFIGGASTTLIALPSVFAYLASELMAMNIKMRLSVTG